ncbi:nuclear transport factor 2 family protein [Falsiruegeria mediterranea]
MIRPSQEVLAVVRRWNDAVHRKDGATLTNMLSRSEYLRYQGSAEGESWSGQLFRQGFGEHVREIPDYDWEEHALEAFECGDVAWAHCLATLTFPNTASQFLHRFTFVLHLEEGNWRMVQLHVSNPLPNMDKMGADHHALDDLIEAARADNVMQGQSGVATVMFTDIVGSSVIAQAVGDVTWSRCVGEHIEAAKACVEANGGRMIKSLGDGTMCTFTSARAAMACAQELQRGMQKTSTEPRIQIRVGLHTGEVIDTGEDFFGTVVNKAARVAALAGPDEIRISDATRLMIGTDPGFSFSDQTAGPLRGFSGTHTTHLLTWRSAPPD